MSYLTSPADVNLIPTRLAILSTAAAISDDDLKNLARGDIRLILTRRPDLKPAITKAYRHGSPAGKAFIDEVVQRMIRPLRPRYGKFNSRSALRLSRRYIIWSIREWRAIK